MTEHQEQPTPDSPEPGHPAGETEPEEGVPERVHEHPEDVGETPSDEQGAEDVTQSPAEGEGDDSE